VRHSWLKLKPHTYICRKCGMGKVNVEQSPGQWVARWSTPDGDEIRMALTPTCAPGPKTAERLEWLAAWVSKHGKALG
jgi:hypothetical protein